VLETLNSAAMSAKTRTTPRKRFGRPKIARRLPGLDLRSAEGKHYSIIYAEVAAEFGAEKRSISRLREVAGLRCALEQIHTEVVRGSAKAREDLVRVSCGPNAAEGRRSLRTCGRIWQSLTPPRGRVSRSTTA
jgi:hypothetical protein